MHGLVSAPAPICMVTKPYDGELNLMMVLYYVSKSPGWYPPGLLLTQRCDTQIEKELLAVVFAFNKFH